MVRVMNTKIIINVVSENEEKFQQINSLLPKEKYELNDLRFEAFGIGMQVKENHDLTIVYLPEELVFTDMSASYNVGLKNSLFVSTSVDDKVRLWAFKQGANDFIVHPFDEVELQSKLLRLYNNRSQNWQHMQEDKTIIEFLKFLHENNVQTIEPTMEPSNPFGYFYPQVANFFGRTYKEFDFLEKLAETHLATRKVHNKIRTCAVCHNYHINFRETCPKCSSVDIQSEEIIHHFACGHIDSAQKYHKGSDLVCPKCNETLRHIGMDYEKPLNYFKCNDCEFIFTEPLVMAQCLWCGYSSTPNNTLEKIIYTYELTELANEAMNTGQIKGLDLATLLHNKFTGLYSKQFFEIELQREFIRSRRQNHKFALMLVRIDNFHKVKTEHAARATEYANNIFTELSKNLRGLDVTCVWSGDTLAMILDGTDEEGAQIVANRMNENVQGLEFLYDIQKPEITVSLVASDQRFNSYNDMLEEIENDLNT